MRTLTGGGFVWNTYLYTKGMSEFLDLWESSYKQDKDEILKQFERFEEEAFINYKVIPLTSRDINQHKMIISVIRDILVISITGRVDSAEIYSEPESLIKEADKTLGNDFNLIMEKVGKKIGSSRLFFQPLRDPNEQVGKVLETIDALPEKIIDHDFGKLFSFDDRKNKSEIYFFLYSEGLTEKVDNFLWNDFPIIDGTLKKTRRLINNYQKIRLENIERKKKIDKYIQDSLKGLKTDDESGKKTFLFEEEADEISEYISWLNNSSNRSKNLITLLRFSIRNLNKIREKYGDSETQYLNDRISSFQEYLKQVNEDYSYLTKTLSDSETALSSLRTKAEISRNNLQSKIYKRAVILVVFLILMLVTLFIAYLQFQAMGVIR